MELERELTIDRRKILGVAGAAGPEQLAGAFGPNGRGHHGPVPLAELVCHLEADGPPFVLSTAEGDQALVDEQADLGGESEQGAAACHGVVVEGNNVVIVE